MSEYDMDALATREELEAVVIAAVHRAEAIEDRLAALEESMANGEAKIEELERNLESLGAIIFWEHY